MGLNAVYGDPDPDTTALGFHPQESGHWGQLKFARATVEKLVDKYIPAEDPRTEVIMPKAAVHQAVSRPEAIHLGRVRLILKDDF